MPSNAIVTGPVTGGRRGWPFSLPLTDLGSVAYLAEEFFLDGTAAAYEAEPGAEFAVDGNWQVRPSHTAPFRIRVLVVRPVDAARFNGVVHVNWQNVTAGFELGTADFESEQLFDGFAWVGVMLTGGILPTVPVQIRDDPGVPALVFNSETEAPALFPVRQPDTDTYRLWEVTGTCHLSGGAGREALAPLLARDGIRFEIGTASGAGVPENRNVLSYTPAYRAAFRHFHNWLEGGPPPPPQARIEFESAEPPTIRRDQYGNALGGIRLPDFAAPTGEHRGSNDGAAILQPIIGYTRPFTTTELHQLYPNQATYVGQWQAALDVGVADGFILPEDAHAMKAIADETAIAIFPK